MYLSPSQGDNEILLKVDLKWSEAIKHLKKLFQTKKINSFKKHIAIK